MAWYSSGGVGQYLIANCIPLVFKLIKVSLASIRILAVTPADYEVNLEILGS